MVESDHPSLPTHPRAKGLAVGGGWSAAGLGLVELAGDEGSRGQDSEGRSMPQQKRLAIVFQEWDFTQDHAPKSR